jgi:hypothetical protein
METRLTIADDALVNDFAREFWRDNVTVEANIDGNYPKEGLPNPLVPTFYFALDAGKIAQLIVVRNKTVTTVGRSARSTGTTFWKRYPGGLWQAPGCGVQ